MTCFNPRTVWQRKTSSLTEPSAEYYRHKKILFKRPNEKIETLYEEKAIACGQCIGCRLDHANEWATRIALEAITEPNAIFLTLTYAEDKIPLIRSGNRFIRSLKKRDVQLFLKRIRKKTEQHVSYFVCGEYGPKTARPHYHMVLFGYKPNDIKEIRKSKTGNPMFTSKDINETWGNGYVTIQPVTYATAAYTARYTMKKCGIRPDKKEWTGEIERIEKEDERNGKKFTVVRGKQKIQKNDGLGREKEFLLASKKPALGLRYWKEHKEQIIRNNGVWIKTKNGEPAKLKPIPGYFQKIWFREEWEKNLMWKYKRKKELDKAILSTIDKMNPIPERTMLPEETKKKMYLETLKKNLEERAKFLKRDQN